MQTTFSLLQDQRQIATDTRQAAAFGDAFGTRAASIIRPTCATRPATATANATASGTASGTATAPAIAPAPASRRRSLAGFTLIEMLVVLSMTGLLTSVALPTFEGQLQRARRSDVLVTMMQVQAAQERWRSNGARYGSLADIGTPGVSPAGHYSLQALSADEDGYVVLATATGTQARDANCRNLSLRMMGANPTYASGPDATVANPESVNRKCWSL